MILKLKRIWSWIVCRKACSRTGLAAPAQDGALETFFSSPIDDIMVPRSDIVAISSQASFADVVQTFLQTGFQWIPIYRDTLDHIIGVLSIHGVLSLQNATPEEKKWYRHLAPAFFAPASMTVKEALNRLQQDPKASSIFIVDEYGGIEGMLSKGHIIHALSAFCLDDFMEEEEDMILSQDPLWVISGRMDLQMFEEELCVPDFFNADDEDRVNTIGGWICSVVGRVPLKGEIITHISGFVFEIRQVDPRRIHQIAILQRPGSEEGSEQNTNPSQDS